MTSSSLTACLGPRGESVCLTQLSSPRSAVLARSSSPRCRSFCASAGNATNNSSGVIGVAWGAQLWSFKDGDSSPDPVKTVCGVEVSRLNGVYAVNISSGFTPYTPLTDKITGAYNQNDMIVVASAGNNNGGAVTYPASIAEVIAVTATDINNNGATFAALGAKIELAAPGVNVISTSLPSGQLGYPCTNGTYVSTCSGTSFAAPAVAAAAAIVKARYPSWTNVQVRQRLQNTATDLGSFGRDSQYGYGLLNLAAAAQ